MNSAETSATLSVRMRPQKSCSGERAAISAAVSGRATGASKSCSAEPVVTSGRSRGGGSWECPYSGGDPLSRRGLLWHASGETRSNVPMAGDLPFAMPDARVITQIAKYDLLRDWEARHAKAFAERDANDMDAVEAAEREKLGAEWGRWLVEQSRELYDGAKSEWRTMASEYRSGGSNLRAQRQRSDAMMEAKWDALTSGLDVS